MRFEASGVTVRFGGVTALEDVDLRVADGEIVGLIGPNGAGKTTFIDAVSGNVRPDSGHVELDGTVLNHLPPHARARLGLARTWQSTDLFRDLTVIENLAVGAHPRMPMFKLGRGRTSNASLLARVEAALATIGLDEIGTSFPEELSGGTQRLIGLARALIGEPRLLLLDEPAAGLNRAETAELASRLRAIVADGPSILLVDHDMGLMLTVCDTVFVLDFGHIVAVGPPAEIRTNREVIEAYLGSRQH
jgi:branched-chain amino acid transport system ATP-binding protein